MAILCKLGPLSTLPQSVHIFVLGLGIILSFTMLGYAQEAVTIQEYGGEKFKYPTFLILCTSFGNILISSFFLVFNKVPLEKWDGGVSRSDWLIVSLGYLGAHFFGLSALLYIPFPLQVVCKSCKTIPVMLGEKIFAGKKHTREKEISVIIMTFSIIAFTLLAKNSSSQDFNLDITFGTGLILVTLALICDGIYGPYQNNICKNHQPSQHHLMFNMNKWELVLSFLICLIFEDISGALKFVHKRPEIRINIISLIICMGIGNLFIFAMQRNFGALTLTTVTTMRKVISVMASVILFGHQISLLQWLAAISVFTAPWISKAVMMLNFEQSSVEESVAMIKKDE